jgi:hypothetical protein
MAKRPRPGPPLSDAEVLAAVLYDAIAALESHQTPVAHAGIEDALASIRFVHRRLVELSETKT